MKIKLTTYHSKEAYKALTLLEQLYREEKNMSVKSLMLSILNHEFQGWVSVMTKDNEVLSCAALESSYKYTGDTVSMRFCRYYKRKSSRTFKYNVYPYFKEYIELCKKNDIKVLYFTVFNSSIFSHINNERMFRVYNKYQEDGVSIKDFSLRKDILFKINDDCTQRIFQYNIDKSFIWNPSGGHIIKNEGFSEEELKKLYKKSKDKGLV